MNKKKEEDEDVRTCIRVIVAIFSVLMKTNYRVIEHQIGTFAWTWTSFQDVVFFISLPNYRRLSICVENEISIESDQWLNPFDI